MRARENGDLRDEIIFAAGDIGVIISFDPNRPHISFCSVDGC